MHKIVEFVDTDNARSQMQIHAKTYRSLHPRLIKNKERFHSDEFSNLLLKQVS